MRVSKLPRTIAAFSVRHPLVALILGLGICMLASLGALQVRIDTHVTALLPDGHPALDRFRLIEERLGATDTLAFAVELPADGATDDAQALVRHLAETMRTWTWERDGQVESMIDGLQGAPDQTTEQAVMDHLLPHTWLFLDDAARAKLIRRLDPRTDKLPRHIWAERLANPSPQIPAELQDRDPFGIWWRTYIPFWQQRVTGDLPLEQDGDYLLGGEGCYLVLICQASQPAQNSTYTRAITTRIRSLLAECSEHWPDLTVKALGPYFLVERDYTIVRSSSITTLITSLLGVLALFALSYRSLRLPGLIVLTLLPATGAALGLTALILGGSLTLVVTAYAAILIGLGVDFVIHLYNGYLWELEALGGDHRQESKRAKRRIRALAILRAVDRVGGGIGAAALTSIGTFLILLAGHYRGLTELGAVCGLGLGLILIQVLVVVPAFLVVAGPARSRTSGLLAPLGRMLMLRPRFWGAAAGVLIAVAGIYLIARPQLIVYDNNPRNLRPANDEIFQQQIDMADKLGLLQSGHQILIRGDDPLATLAAGKDLLQRINGLTEPTTLTLDADLDVAALRQSGSLKSLPVSGLPSELTGRRTIRLAHGDILFEGVAGDHLVGLSPSTTAPPPPAIIPAGTTVTLLPLVGNATHPLAWFPMPADQRQAMAAMRAIDWPAVDASIASAKPEIVSRRQPFLQDIQALRERIAADQVLMPSDLMRTPLGSLLVRVWSEDENGVLLRLPIHLNRTPGQPGFDETLQALGLDRSGAWVELAPGVEAGNAGAPSIGVVLADILHLDFNHLALLATLVTIGLLAVTMRSWMDMSLAMATLGAGLTLALAAMHLLGMKWNLMNIAALPLIMGIGVDNGIHFLHAARHHGLHRDGLRRALTETGHPMMITALTSIIGFGSLTLNAYQGVQSFGLTAAMGIFACLLVALGILPLCCLYRGHKRQQRLSR